MGLFFLRGYFFKTRVYGGLIEELILLERKSRYVIIIKNCLTRLKLGHYHVLLPIVIKEVSF